MKDRAFYILLLNNNIRLVDENSNSFYYEARELTTFEVPRYPMNDVIIWKCAYRKKR